jgi:enoyl-CoA hydratase/carnithine racemase
MDIIERAVTNGVATLALARGKVNAINPQLVQALEGRLDEIEKDNGIRAVVLTGRGSFFSFGWDVPELLPYEPDAFAAFVTRFTRLYRRLFAFPKPVVAAINGHAPAGGCMLALACDVRIMASASARIGLNEITFAAGLPAGSIEMLRFWVGSARATRVVVTGTLFAGADALELGLVDRLMPQHDVLAAAQLEAASLAIKAQPAYAITKKLLRQRALEDMDALEAASIAAFVPVWYSAATREELKKIVIR